MHHTKKIFLFLSFFFFTVYGSQTIKIIFEKPVVATMSFDRSFLIQNSVVFSSWFSEYPETQELHLDDDFVTFNYITASLKANTWVNLEGVVQQVLPIAYKYQMTKVLQLCKELIIANMTESTILNQLDTVLRYELATYEQVKLLETQTRYIFNNWEYNIPNERINTAFQQNLPYATAVLCQEKTRLEKWDFCKSMLSDTNLWKSKTEMVLTVLKLLNINLEPTGDFCSGWRIAQAPTEEFFAFLLEKGCTLPPNALKQIWDGNRDLFNMVLNMTKYEVSTLATLLELGFIPLFTKLVKPEMVNKTDFETNDLRCLLNTAVRLKLPYVTKMLLDMKADPNLGFPVHKAASMQNYDLFMMLLSYGANPFLKDQFGRNAFECSSREPKVLHWIEQFHFEIGFSDSVMELFNFV